MSHNFVESLKKYYKFKMFACFFFFISDSITEVFTNIYVTSFGPVSDTDMVSFWIFCIYSKCCKIYTLASFKLVFCFYLL